MKTIKDSNMSSLNVGKAVESLSEAYIRLINKGLPLKTFPSVMLWGPPGVGKSQAVRQIAERIEDATGKKAVVTDVRLLLYNPIDLRGIPTANEDKTLAVWLKPKVFQMDESSKVVNILLLDEISAAPQSVQAAAYQITLDRVIGEHKLPENCIVIAAGNRVTDKSVAVKMPKALANRLLHMEIEVNADAWRTWAVQHGINDKVTGFLAFRPDYLMGFDSSGDDLAFPTPRTWEMVSNVLSSMDATVDDVYPMIAGLVGSGAAIELRAWEKIYHNLPPIKDIFDGRKPAVPKDTDTLYALISSMVVYAREHKKETARIENSIEYASLMPPDFATALIKDYMYLDKDYKNKLMKMPSFNVWMQKYGHLLN